jgi:hypothetical protein
MVAAKSLIVKEAAMNVLIMKQGCQGGGAKKIFGGT